MGFDLGFDLNVNTTWDEIFPETTYLVSDLAAHYIISHMKFSSLT